MEKKHDKLKSSSTEQQESGNEMIALFEQQLGLRLDKDFKLFVNDCRVELDFYCEKSGIIGEVYSRIGKLSSSQKHKISNDLLKLILVEQEQKKVFSKYYLVHCSSVYSYLKGSSWLATAFKVFGIELVLIKSSSETIQTVIKAQKR